MTYKLLLLLFFFSPSCIFSQDLVPYKKGDLYGYSDPNGKLIIDPNFDHAERFNGSGFAIVSVQGNAMIIDSTGKLMTGIKGLEFFNGEFDEISGYRSKFYFKKGDYRGVIDSVLSFAYYHSGESLYVSEDPNYLRISKKIGKKSHNAIINIKGDTIFPYRLPAGKGSNCKVFHLNDTITICYENRIRGVNFYKDRKYVFIDSIYKNIIFKLLKSDGVILCVKPNNTIDLINSDFEFVYSNFNPNNLTNQDFFKDENLRSKLGISLISKLLSKHKNFSCTLDPVYNSCVCRARGEIYADGKSLVDEPEKYLHINRELGIILYKNGEERGVRNFKKEDIIPLTKNRIIFSHGLKRILIKEDEKYCFYSLDGEKIESFDFANSWVVKDNRRSKFAIHRGDGEPISEYMYDTLITMNNGINYFGLLDGKFTVLDSLGKQIGNQKYDNLSRMKDYVLTENEGKKGIIHIEKWEEFIQPQYDNIEIFCKYPYVFSVVLEGKNYLVNSGNKILDIDPESVRKFNRDKMPDMFISASLKDKSSAFFSPEGEIIVIPNINKRWKWYDKRKKYPDYFPKDGHYVNYKTGLRYME